MVLRAVPGSAVSAMSVRLLVELRMLLPYSMRPGLILALRLLLAVLPDLASVAMSLLLLQLSCP
jgi:hypothetical protein